MHDHPQLSVPRPVYLLIHSHGHSIFIFNCSLLTLCTEDHQLGADATKKKHTVCHKCKYAFAVSLSINSTWLEIVPSNSWQKKEKEKGSVWMPLKTYSICTILYELLHRCFNIHWFQFHLRNKPVNQILNAQRLFICCCFSIHLWKISVVPLRGLSPVAGASPVLPVNRHVVAG